jgi:DNA polymerase-3 subunit delta'
MAFSDIKGQDKAIEILKGIMIRGRLAHAYLFTGDKGVGKYLTAKTFAKALNCMYEGTYSQFDSCGLCSSCIKIEKGIHPDVFELQPEKGQIKVDMIRKLEDDFSLKAFEGKWKIALIDDAETLNPYAGNAFLKTLEEPPQMSLMILITSRPDILLPTIRSRCQNIHFTPLRSCDMEALLKEKGYDNVSLISCLSGGRVGLALDSIVHGDRDDAFSKISGLCKSADFPLWEKRDDIIEWIDWMLLFLRDMAVSYYSNDLFINHDIAFELKDMMHHVKEQDLLHLVDEMLKLKGLLRFNLNKQLTEFYIGSLIKKTFGRINKEHV